MLKILVLLEDRLSDTYKFDKPEVSIGRSPENDIMLDNLGVSREHATIEFIDGHWVLRDLESREGTLVNDSPLISLKAYYLRDGDTIQIGKFSLAVQML